MNKNVILAVTVLALLTVSPVQAANHCSNKQVKLHIPKNELRVTPPDPKCVSDVNPTFTIAIKPPGKAAQGAVTVVEKSDVLGTIRGDNSVDADIVVVTVDLENPANGPYGYIIRVEGHGELDPEVRIVTSRMLLNSLMDEVDAMLEDEMGISLIELNEKQKNLKDIEGMQKQAD